MPRLSLWRDGAHSNDYKFFDRRISEQFTVGGTSIAVHKYLGPPAGVNSGDATQPNYANQSELNIQDLLFLENRDRKYDPDIYLLRGMYQVQDNDFDLSQFGLFLANGTILINFHLNDMIQVLGRKLMAGDVLELPHLKDYNTLDGDTVPIALKRYYVITEAKWPSEGFSPTWWPHLWRAKCTPLVNSQEYKDIIDQIAKDVTGDANANSSSVSDIISTLDIYTSINDQIIVQAETDVPKSGYDTANLYTLPIDRGTKLSVSSLLFSNIGLGYFGANASVQFSTPQVIGQVAEGNITLYGNGAVANVTITDPGYGYTEAATITFLGANTYPAIASVIMTRYDNPGDPRNSHPDKSIGGYLVGDGIAPNAWDITAGVSFPVDPSVGDYFLRLDYLPNRLFRFDGARWSKIEDNVRSNLTPGPNNKTLRSSFVNNMATYTDFSGNTKPSRQALNKIFKPGADN